MCLDVAAARIERQKDAPKEVPDKAAKKASGRRSVGCHTEIQEDVRSAAGQDKSVPKWKAQWPGKIRQDQTTPRNCDL